MSEHLSLERSSLVGAVEKLQDASKPLESVNLSGDLAFESLTGIADAVHEFLSVIKRAAQQLAEGASASGYVVTHLLQRGSEVDLQLASAAAAGSEQIVPQAEGDRWT